MALTNIKTTVTTEVTPVEELVVKKSGPYEYVDTPNEGIKKIVSKQGGYLVFLDYGRKLKINKKTGKQEYKQDKTARRVETEAEAKKLRREAEMTREGIDPKTHKVKKILFKQMVEEYKQSQRYKDLAPSNQDHVDNHIRHILDYMADMEPCKITAIDIENYYSYSLNKGNLMTKMRVDKGWEKKRNGICVGTVAKHKVTLNKLWEYMIDAKKYGVFQNVVKESKLPKVEIEIDGKKRKVSKIPYHARSLSIEELNYTLNDIIQNEFDRSIAVAVALAALGSLRHSEVDAMNCKNFYHNELMNVSPNTMEYGGYDKEYYEQHEELMFVDSAIMTIHCKDTLQLPKGGIVRVCAIPKALREIVDYAMEQRRQVYALIDKEITGDEQLYMPMTYLFSGKKFNAQKLGRRWTEYQRRRNKRMEEAGLEPIPEVRFHDLRHTHSNLTKMEVPSWQISCNMGHKLSKDDECVTKTVYWNDRQPYRNHIIDFFDKIIKLDWDKAMRKDVDERLTINSSGHLVIPVTRYVRPGNEEE